MGLPLCFCLFPSLYYLTQAPSETGTGGLFANHLLFQNLHLELKKDLHPGCAANLPWALDKFIALRGLPRSLFINDRLCPTYLRGTEALFKQTCLPSLLFTS